MKIWKKHGPSADVKTKIPLNENKNWEAFEIVQLTEKEKEDIANNKVCQICPKVFAQKSNHNRHIAKWHRPDSNAFDKCVEPTEDISFCFLFPANPVVTEVVDAIPTRIPEKDNEDIVQPNQKSMSQEDKTLHTHKKQSRLKKMLLYDCH